MTEALVLAGGASKRRNEKPIFVNFALPHKTVLLNVEKMAARLQASIPERLLDLLEVAMAVYAADQLVSRGGRSRTHWGAAWRRRLRFRIAVRDIAFWHAPKVQKALSEAVGFLTEDEFGFEFVESSAPATQNTYFDFDPSLDGAFEADDIILFSGGLDSLAGAIETLSTTDRRIVLVTHLAANKVHHFQRELAYELTERFQGRVFWLPMNATLTNETKARDRTQRSRTFLFAAMGFVAAQMFGAKTVRFFENGIVSLNLPISAQVVGTMATRTTHPRSLLLIEDFLRCVSGDTTEIENPFFFKTKTDVVETICSYGHADLIRRTFSCSHVLMSTTLHRHCGRCSQCIDRRFGVLSAGAGQFDPAEAYDTDLLVGERPSPEDRTMALDYVRRARSATNLSLRSFMTSYGSDVGRILDCFQGVSSNEVIERTRRLHQRHGVAVSRVLEQGIQDHAGHLLDAQVPETALIRLCMQSPEGAARPDSHRDDDLALEGRTSAGETALELVVPSGPGPIRVLGLGELNGSQKLLILELKKQFDEDASRPREDARFMRTRAVADALGWEDTYVRQVAKRCRHQLDEFYEAVHGEAPGASLLIQSAPRRGYRLDPLVRFVSAEAKACHASPSKVSRKHV